MNTVEILLLVFGGVLGVALLISMAIRRFYWKDYKKRHDSINRLRGRIE